MGLILVFFMAPSPRVDGSIADALTVKPGFIAATSENHNPPRPSNK